jgi:hypothetical protein
MATTFWNTESTLWNSYDTFWNEEVIIPIVTATGGVSPMEFNVKDINLSENKEKNQLIKIFLTVHNQFLTEEQKKMVKISKAYPTYEEQQYIKENVRIILENLSLKDKQKLDKLPKKVKLKNIKIGLKKIIDHVTYNTSK